jgi:hypothetical protein
VSAPFVTTLRTSGSAIRVGAPGANAITIRVEVPERWDVALIEALPTTSVREVKEAALRDVSPGDDASAYVIKLRGFEVLDESVSLADAGARNGSIFLLTNRRRRPVR